MFAAQDSSFLFLKQLHPLWSTQQKNKIFAEKNTFLPGPGASKHAPSSIHTLYCQIYQGKMLLKIVQPHLWLGFFQRMGTWPQEQFHGQQSHQGKHQEYQRNETRFQFL